VGALEVDPLRNRVVLCASRLTFAPLHVDRRPGEEAVPTAVVEVQVRVDCANDITRDGVWIEAGRPFLVELWGRVDQPGVDQDAALRVLDHVQETGPAFTVDEYVSIAIARTSASRISLHYGGL
jgi:hypothetical protein